MRIKVSPAAAESGALRIRLRRIPIESGTYRAFRLNEKGEIAEEVAHADLYGRGEGSNASESSMLLFRFRPAPGLPQPAAGEELEIRAESSDGKLAPANLDVVAIE